MTGRRGKIVGYWLRRAFDVAAPAVSLEPATWQANSVPVCLVAPEAQESLLVADRVWHEEGCPREVRALGGVLQKILQRCQSSAIWYAPVLRRRKKGLQRGTWHPDSVAKPIAARAGSPPKPAACARSGERQSHGEVCAICGGTGIRVHGGGFSDSLCPCGALLASSK